ncbi:MAG TPA: tyrosine-type recombinase/integrase [Nevskiaceae bacterium]|nr:tyrosine-type recombinase/integrase [Nevskiaceae bacterium]
MRTEPVTLDRVSLPALPADLIRARIVEWERRYRAARSPATMKAIRSDWSAFMRWAIGNHVAILPIAPADLVRYLTDLVVEGKRRATVDRALNTIRVIHGAAGLGDPTRFPDWKLEWQSIVRQLADHRKNAPRQAKALKASHVDRILASLGDSPRDLRDAALISLASDTLCRESELVALRLEDFEPSPPHWAVELRRSKTDQAAIGTSRFCSSATKARLDAWCSAAGITSGFLFYRVMPKKLATGAKAIILHNAPLRPAEVARIFLRRARAAGLTGVHFTGHSARVGSAVELIESDASVTAVRFAGGWNSDRMVMRYARGALVGRGAMAQLRAAQTAGRSAGGPDGALAGGSTT